ncbi:hypothetical protein LP420_36600 [Massilia sp. B-10]|nr:hypothetical protein LP420_36600 [Massilia sp. B-10]
MAAAALLQVAATALLNGGFAWMTGALLARAWLTLAQWGALPSRAAPVSGRRACLPAGRRWRAVGLGRADGRQHAGRCAADVVAGRTWHGLWPGQHARDGRRAGGGAGHAAAARALSLNAIGAASTCWCLPWRAPRPVTAGRAVCSQACYAIDTLHLLLIGVWLGGVAVAAWWVLLSRAARAWRWPNYLDQLSGAAGLALASKHHCHRRMEQLAAPVGAMGPAGPPLRHRAVAQAEPVRHRRLARRLEPFLGLPPGPGLLARASLAGAADRVADPCRRADHGRRPGRPAAPAA